MKIKLSDLPNENLLIGQLTNRCRKHYDACGDCKNCNHPLDKCSSSCKCCSEQVHSINKKTGDRVDYNCQKLLFYYVCRYSWKYCSEIMYALENIDLSRYNEYNILSIGCGGVPDLMAFEQINREDKKPIHYTGIDKNSLWRPIHDEVKKYFSDSSNISINFQQLDILKRLKTIWLEAVII